MSRTTEPGSSRGRTANLIEDERLSTGEVRERAVTGAAVDVLRGFGVRFMGLVGTLVLARLLTPHDFGIIAFGATLVTFANFLTDGGIAAGLIRRVDPPTRAELRAFLAFQLGFNSLLAGVVGIALLPVGEFGQLTAMMMIALPLTAVRVPGVILLERRLNYRPLAFVEIVESICYYGWAIVTVSYGWGVWGAGERERRSGSGGQPCTPCLGPIRSIDADPVMDPGAAPPRFRIQVPGCRSRKSVSRARNQRRCCGRRRRFRPRRMECRVSDPSDPVASPCLIVAGLLPEHVATRRKWRKRRSYDRAHRGLGRGYDRHDPCPARGSVIAARLDSSG